MSGGARALRPGVGLSVAAKGLQATAVNSEVEVPHYKLQEDPSFWTKNNMQVCTYCRFLHAIILTGWGFRRSKWHILYSLPQITCVPAINRNSMIILDINV
jgi:hypothetical protein